MHYFTVNIVEVSCFGMIGNCYVLVLSVLSDISTPPPLRLALGRASVFVTMKCDGCAHERNLYWESSHAILNNAVTLDVQKGICEGHKNICYVERF